MDPQKTRLRRSRRIGHHHQKSNSTGCGSGKEWRERMFSTDQYPTQIDDCEAI